MANFDLMCCLAMADGGKTILLFMDRLAREGCLGLSVPVARGGA